VIEPTLSDIFSATIPFVMTRRKTTGGFGATPRLPATIEDTYHALNILNLARKYNALDKNEFDPLVDEPLRSYLETRRQTLTASTRTTFQMLWCCRTVGLELDRDAVAADAISRLQAYDSLEVWYYGARILVEVLGSESLPFSENRNLATVLGHAWRAVDEAWMHMYISRKFRNNLPQPAPEMISWFQACQNGDGGFGFFPGTTSFVENCFACLQALAVLNASPRDPKLAFRFLTGAQNASGGFCRNSRAVAFLYSTWDALAALAILNLPR
jgi:hypothetical protein